VVSLEEPEQTVNPGILLVLADAIKTVVGKSQIIVTTHSPSLIDHFDVSEIYSVSLSDTGTVVHQVRGHQLDAVRRGLFSVGELMIMEGLGN
ncbi:MAG: AAA family ATPase, partial [Dehalococcoidia bacterium]